MAFIGLCIGIPLAAGNAEARQWIFAVAAGMFLYVALVDMVSCELYIRDEIVQTFFNSDFLFRPGEENQTIFCSTKIKKSC